MLQEVISFFGEHFLLFSVVSAIVVIVVIAGIGVMFSQLRGQIKKLTNEVESKEVWEQFFFDIKAIHHFPTFIDKYQNVAKKAPYPSGEFWKEELQEVTDRFISTEVELYSNTFKAEASLTDYVEVLLLMKKMEELVWISRELASPRMQGLIKEMLNVPINTALGLLKNSDDEAYKIGQKIKAFIYPEPVTYAEPVLIYG